MIKDKIKALLKISGKGNADAAAALDMPYHSFANKINQRGFKTEELIQLAELTETELAFLDKKTGNKLIAFDLSDLPDKE